MARFLTHECVAAGVFNADFECTASTATMSPWNDTLKNNLPVLQLLLARMESDYVVASEVEEALERARHSSCASIPHPRSSLG